MEKSKLYKSGVYDKKTVEGLVSLDDPEFIQELVGIFQKNTPTYLAELDVHFKERNAWGMRQILHKMRGSCGTLGAVSMLLVVESLRDALIQEDWRKVTTTLSKLKETWAATSPYLNLMFGLNNS